MLKKQWAQAPVHHLPLPLQPCTPSVPSPPPHMAPYTSLCAGSSENPGRDLVWILSLALPKTGMLGGFWNPEHHQAVKAGISTLPTPTMLPPVPRSPPLAPLAIPWQCLMGTFESPVGRKYRCESCRTRESVGRAQEREGSYPNVGQATLPPCSWAPLSKGLWDCLNSPAMGKILLCASHSPVYVH